MKNALPYKRELYRLWFEYLKLARSNPRLKDDKQKRELQTALKGSVDFYAPWGNIDGVKFDSWWKDHRQLFEDTEKVRRLKRGEATPLDPDILVIQVPMTRSPTVLAQEVKTVIEMAFAETKRATNKSKKLAQSTFRPTEGAEPKFDAVRESLTVYRDVRLKYTRDDGKMTLRGQAFLDAVRAFYKGRKNRKWANIPYALLEADNTFEGSGEDRAQRNLLRYCQRAETIMLNVANGQFPGKYV